MDFANTWCLNCKSQVARDIHMCNHVLQVWKIYLVMVHCRKIHYCLTDLSVDSNDITALVSGEQKHYFHLWGLQKPLVAFATRDFFRPHS
jgi:hypothetical protein